jgi:hypothetical protein
MMTTEEGNARLYFYTKLSEAEGVICESQRSSEVTEIAAFRARHQPQQAEDFERFMKILALCGLLDKLATRDAATDAALIEEIKRRWGALVGQGSSPLEMMAIENVLLCWLRLIYSENEMSRTREPGCSARYAKFAAGALKRAQKRLSDAEKALERMRGLLKSNRGSGK